MQKGTTSCEEQSQAAKKADLGLCGAWAPKRDLSTIAFFRAAALLRRHGPVPGILAARRPGAIMDKSGCLRLATQNALKTQNLS